VANLFEARKVPEIWKLAALPRFHRLDGAIVAFEKNALAICLFKQGQSQAIRAQPRELLNEFELAHLFECGEPRDFRLGQTHLSRPAATSRATFAFIKDRHAKE